MPTPNFVGGAELMAHEQALALTRLGYVVHVFAGDPDAPRERYSRHDDVYEGIRIHRIALTPEDYSPEYLNFLHPAVEAHFCSILTDFEPDIVHCHNLMGLSAKLPLFARQQGAGIVCTLHDFWVSVCAIQQCAAMQVLARTSPNAKSAYRVSTMAPNAAFR
jgi:hypothetical protein